jgi:hypothetical protein
LSAGVTSRSGFSRTSSTNFVRASFLALPRSYPSLRSDTFLAPPLSQPSLRSDTSELRSFLGCPPFNGITLIISNFNFSRLYIQPPENKKRHIPSAAGKGLTPHLSPFTPPRPRSCLDLRPAPPVRPSAVPFVSLGYPPPRSYPSLRSGTLRAVRRAVRPAPADSNNENSPAPR